MTAQIKDLFLLCGDEYLVGGISERCMFDLAEFGLSPRPTCTACFRGYYATLAIIESHLVLQSLYVNLFGEPPQQNEPMTGIAINGIVPNTECSDSGLFNNQYENINYRLRYTGGVLLLGDYNNQLSRKYFFHIAWNYRTVRELLFENGRLVKNIDRSEQVDQAREQVLVGRETSKSIRWPSRKERLEISHFLESQFEKVYW